VHRLETAVEHVNGPVVKVGRVKEVAVRQNPGAVAQQHRVIPWSDAHLAILRRHLRALADLGQTYVSTYITHSPWNDDTYIPDGTIVDWIREPDGRFTFDYRIFDTYVELAMSSGIGRAICCFTLIPWDGRVRYLDRTSGEYVWTKWQTDSPEYMRFWKTALADLRAHLMQRGWFEKTYLEVNERSLEDNLRAVRVARDLAMGREALAAATRIAFNQREGRLR